MRNRKLEIRDKNLEIRDKKLDSHTTYHALRVIIKITITLLITLGFALRLYTLGSESLWYDELLQLDIAQGSLTSILPQLPRHTAVPLDYLISHFWIFLGRSDAWVRLPAVMVGTLTLPLMYQLGRALFSQAEGLLLMALLALSPFHIRYSQEVRPYALIVLGIVLAWYAYWRLRVTGRWRYILLLQTGVLIFSLSHLFAITMFAPLFILAGVDLWFTRQRRNSLRRLWALMGTGVVALVCLLALGYGATLYYSTAEFSKAVAEPEKFTVTAAEKPNRGTGPQVNQNFIQTQLFGPLGAGDSVSSLWLFNGLVGLGFFYLLVQKKYYLSLLLGLWLIVPVVAIVSFLVYRGTFFAPRYIILVLPAYLALLSIGLLALPCWLRCTNPKWVSMGTLLVLGGLVLTQLVAELNQLYFTSKNENWRLVSQFLAQNAHPDEAVITVNAESVMNWYYPPATAPVNTFDTLAAIQSHVAGARRSWVILSIFSNYLGDELPKIQAWLSEQGAIRLTFDPVIDVYYLGSATSPPQLLQELQGMALPVDHTLYASLARENRRDPTVARRYYELAIQHAPDEATRAEYQKALEELKR